VAPDERQIPLVVLQSAECTSSIILGLNSARNCAGPLPSGQPGASPTPICFLGGTV
jgi:hypothetical protein